MGREAGTAYLEKLANDNQTVRTERVGRKAPYAHLRAYVYHAQKDRVVTQDNFDADFASEPVMGKNHRSICKPKGEYVTPADALKMVFGGFSS